MAAAVGLLAGTAGARALTTARLRIPFPEGDGTLTPYTFVLGYPLMTLIYDTIEWRDPGGVPRPWLASSVTRSGDTVVVRLRHGVRWQDGVPLTAADVVFTYRYFATHQQPRFTPELSDLLAVTQTGADKVTFVLRPPSLGFEDQPLSDIPILPVHLWADLPAGRVAPPGLPVGSGPYRLVSYNARAGYRFVANSNYFRGRPTVREIDVPIIRQARGTIDALANNTVDAVPVELTAPEADELSGDLGVRIITGDSYTGTVLMLNTSAPPFDSPAIRRAVAESLDLSSIAATMGSLPNGPLAVPADRGLLDPSSPWASRRPLAVYDPSAARVVLAEQGEPPITVLAPDNDPLREAAGREVVGALTAVGARAALELVAPAALDRAVGADGYAPSYQAAIWTTPALASYDPSFLGALFGNPLRTPLNYTGYSSPAFDRVAARVEDAPTLALRHRAVADELALLAHDAPVVPLFFDLGAFAFRSSVYDGWVYVKGTGILDKQSFLSGGRTPPSPTPANRSVGPPPNQDSGAGTLLIFGIAIAGVLTLAALWRWRLRHSR